MGAFRVAMRRGAKTRSTRNLALSVIWVPGCCRRFAAWWSCWVVGYRSWWGPLFAVFVVPASAGSARERVPTLTHGATCCRRFAAFGICWVVRVLKLMGARVPGVRSTGFSRLCVSPHAYAWGYLLPPLRGFWELSGSSGVEVDGGICSPRLRMGLRAAAASRLLGAVGQFGC